jgi:peroxiredoxin Q/BCP
MRLLIIILVLLVGGTAALLALRQSSQIPLAGSAAPDFSVSSQEGDRVSLKDYRGRWVVLYFYPRDMTPGCTIEARNFQRDQPQYTQRNAMILGVSVDSADSHKKFCAKEGLNFKLLSDSDYRVSSEYGSLRNLLVVKIASRHTFIIDPDGKVARVYTNVDPNRHSREVLAALDELQKASPSPGR